MCEASQTFGYSVEGLVCTLPKGHQGEHVDHGESIAWHWIDEVADSLNGGQP